MDHWAKLICRVCILVLLSLYTQSMLAFQFINDSITMFTNQELSSFLMKHDIQVNMQLLDNDAIQLLELLEKVKMIEHESNINEASMQIRSKYYIGFDNYAYTFPSLTENYAKVEYRTIIHANSIFEVFDIPFGLSAGVVFKDFEKTPSSYFGTFNFSHHEFLNKKATEYKAHLKNKAAETIATKSKDMYNLATEAEFHLLKLVIGNISYQNKKALLYNKLDSIKDINQEEFNPENISLYDSLQLEYKKFMILDSIFRERNIFMVNKSDHVGRMASRAQVMSIMDQIDFDMESTAKLLKQQDIKWHERLLLNTKAFQIGDVYPTETRFGICQLSLRGGRYAYDDGELTIEIGHGYRNLSGIAGRVPRTKFFSTVKDQTRFSYIKASSQHNGVLLEGSIVHANGYRYPAHQEFSSQRAKNTVFELRAAVDLAKDLKLVTDYAYSESVYSENDNVKSRDTYKRPLTNAGLSMMVEYCLKVANLNLSFGYFRIGSEFLSFANPFVLINREGISGAIHGSLFNNRLNLGINGQFGAKLSDFEQDTGNRDWNVDLTASFRVSRNLHLQAVYVPTLWHESFYNIDNDSSKTIRLENQIMQVSGIVNYEMFKDWEFNHVISISNFNAQYSIYDTASLKQVMNGYALSRFKSPGSLFYQIVTSGGFGESNHVFWRIEAGTGLEYGRAEVNLFTVYANEGIYNFPVIGAGLAFTHSINKRLFIGIDGLVRWEQDKILLQGYGLINGNMRISYSF